MEPLTVTIPGKPMGKQRHRTFTRGKFASSYTPTKTVNYETLVKLLFIERYPNRMNGRPDFVPIDGAVAVGVRAYYQIPKSTSKKRRAMMLAGEILPTVKPDMDNVIKIISDALNGIAYTDDKNITDYDPSPRKRYSDTPRVEITISRVGDNESE